MSLSTNSQVKNVRSVFRQVTRETERLLDRTLGSGKTTTLPLVTLQYQVALNTGLPLFEVVEIVKAYVSTRTDIRLFKPFKTHPGFLRKVVS